MFFIFMSFVASLSAQEMTKSPNGINTHNLIRSISMEKKGLIEKYLHLLDETIGTEYDQCSAQKKSNRLPFIIRQGFSSPFFTEPSEILAAILWRNSEEKKCPPNIITILRMTTDNSLFSFIPSFLRHHQKDIDQVLALEKLK